MSDEYTPTTDEVRRGFEAPRYRTDPREEDESFSAYLSRVSIKGMHSRIASEGAFNRWLSAHDAEVSSKAWDEGYMAVPAEPEDREFFVEDAPNPYRQESAP